MNESLFVDALRSSGVSFFTGVPDSFLHGFCSELGKRDGNSNIITANEGNAVAVAVGHYLSTGEIPLVYMQNSGLGNALNPLASLACRPMLGVPMVLLIGWRGDPWHPDHVQHELQGKITPTTLGNLGISHRVLGKEISAEGDAAAWAVSAARKTGAPVALLAPKGVLSGSKKSSVDGSYPLSREEAISAILDAAPSETAFCATTGRASRELFHLRESRGEGHSLDYLNVGSMGHASSVALGLAIGKPDRRVICLDGDAAVIMHMGALAVIPSIGVSNLLHIVLNNGAHESVGGQPSVGWKVDFTSIASACGYATVGHPVSTAEEIALAVSELLSSGKTAFLDVRIHLGMRPDIPGLEVDPEAMRDCIMKELDAR